MHICKQNCGKFIFNAILCANGLYYATVLSRWASEFAIKVKCTQKVRHKTKCRLMRGRSPHIRHLLSLPCRFAYHSVTTRIPLGYHSVTTLNITAWGHPIYLSIVHCQLSTVHCQLSSVLLSAVFRRATSDVHCQLSTVNCPLSIGYCPLISLRERPSTPQNCTILTISAIFLAHIKKMLYICGAIPRRGMSA